MMIHLVPVGHHGLVGGRKRGEGTWRLALAFFSPLQLSPDFMEVKNVVRSRSDDVDRRFCFECDLVTLK